jgi:hypothetical protein
VGNQPADFGGLGRRIAVYMGVLSICKIFRNRLNRKVINPNTPGPRPDSVTFETCCKLAVANFWVENASDGLLVAIQARLQIIDIALMIERGHAPSPPSSESLDR